MVARRIVGTFGEIVDTFFDIIQLSIAITVFTVVFPIIMSLMGGIKQIMGASPFGAQAPGTQQQQQTRYRRVA